MPSVLRKFLYIKNRINRQKPDPDEIMQEKWTADFRKQNNTHFIIKSESSHDANLRKDPHSGSSLVLALKKSGCIAWLEAPDYRYRDMIISGSIRIHPHGGYGAGGIHFRIVDAETYYSFLISNKGYFRLDAVRNGMPLPLVGWTEIPLSRGAELNPDQSVDFSIVAYGSHLIIIIRGFWVAEVTDTSIYEGYLALTAASYEAPDGVYWILNEEDETQPDDPAGDAAADTGVPKRIRYSTEVFLESFSVDSRNSEITALYEKWQNSANIDPKARLNLAETFTAMNQYNAAMVQLRKSWKTQGYRKTQRELLLAGRISLLLEQMGEAEDFISQCFQADVDSFEGKQALTEMTKVLYGGRRFDELKSYCAEALKIKKNDPVLWTFRGHAFWEFKEYKNAAAAYDRAFKLDSKNGILAKNAANVFEIMGSKNEALIRYLNAGRAFLSESNYNDLGLLVPKLLSLGKNEWEAHSLAGKWAFAVEDWAMAEKEFTAAEKLRMARQPLPPKDGAQVFLQALLLVRAGKRRKALPLFEEAVSLEKNYALFRFRLAENLFLLNDNPDDPRMKKELLAALVLTEANKSDWDDSLQENRDLCGWVNNFAAQVALRKGDTAAAEKHLEKAAEIMGDVPAVLINRGVLLYLQGSLDKALELLNADKKDDPEGSLANCAGNLLVRSGRLEEADEKYRQALTIQSDNVEYLYNRASCLMELGLYGEADELLVRALTIAPSAEILAEISYVAAKKGEYLRAEQACRSALEIDSKHGPSLLSLGWILLTLGRPGEVIEIINSLDALELKDDVAKGREDLRARMEEQLFKSIACVSCDRSWKVLKDPPQAKSIRLIDMPPDELPAGACPECGKTYCIGCAKKNLDASGRFICPDCNRSLKLVNEGLKKIIYDWAANNEQTGSEPAAGKKAKTPAEPVKTGQTLVSTPAKQPVKRKRGENVNKKTQDPA